MNYVPTCGHDLLASQPQYGFDTNRQHLIDEQEKDSRYRNEDENHHRRNHSFAAGWPSDFRHLAPNLLHEFAWVGLRHLRLNLSLAVQFVRPPFRVAGVEGLEPTTPGFGDRCSAN